VVCLIEILVTINADCYEPYISIRVNNNSNRKLMIRKATLSYGQWYDLNGIEIKTPNGKVIDVGTDVRPDGTHVGTNNIIVQSCDKFRIGTKGSLSIYDINKGQKVTEFYWTSNIHLSGANTFNLKDIDQNWDVSMAGGSSTGSIGEVTLKIKYLK